MDAKEVREKIIKPKLAELFGNIIANALVSKAAVAGMKGSSNKEKLILMVESVCNDQKVIGMWGIAQTNKQKNEWLNLIQ
ncbi:hypothetical protein ACFL4Z_00710 [candidate division KSB1 bacterium]